MAEIGSVTIKVNLDITETKRQLAEQNKQVQKQEQDVKRVAEKITGRKGPSPGAQREGESLTDKILDEVGKRASNAASSNAVGAASRMIVGSRIGQAVGEAALGESGFSTAAKTVGTAAAVYGVAKIGTTLAIGLTEALKAAMPDLLQDSATFNAVQDRILDISKVMDNFESRIISLVTATQNVAEIGNATARLGGVLPDLGYYWQQEQSIAVEQRDLDRAFDRFRYRSIAGAVGKSVANMFKMESK